MVMNGKKHLDNSNKKTNKMKTFKKFLETSKLDQKVSNQEIKNEYEELKKWPVLALEKLWDKTRPKDSESAAELCSTAVDDDEAKDVLVDKIMTHRFGEWERAIAYS